MPVFLQDFFVETTDDISTGANEINWRLVKLFANNISRNEISI
jgi:hypothetical protein